MQKPATLASNSAITSSASSKPWRPSASMPSTPTFTEANTGKPLTWRKPISAHFRSLGLENPFKKKPSRESPSKARAARAYWSRFSLSDALLDASSGRPHGPSSTSTCWGRSFAAHETAARASSGRRSAMPRCARRAGVMPAVSVTRHCTPAIRFRRRASSTASGSISVAYSTSPSSSNPWRASTGAMGLDSTSISRWNRSWISGMDVSFRPEHDTKGPKEPGKGASQAHKRRPHPRSIRLREENIGFHQGKPLFYHPVPICLATER